MHIKLRTEPVYYRKPPNYIYTIQLSYLILRLSTMDNGNDHAFCQENTQHMKHMHEQKA